MEIDATRGQFHIECERAGLINCQPSGVLVNDCGFWVDALKGFLKVAPTRDPLLDLGRVCRIKSVDRLHRVKSGPFIAPSGRPKKSEFRSVTVEFS